MGTSVSRVPIRPQVALQPAHHLFRPRQVRQNIRQVHPPSAPNPSRAVATLFRLSAASLAAVAASCPCPELFNSSLIAPTIPLLPIIFITTGAVRTQPRRQARWQAREPTISRTSQCSRITPAPKSQGPAQGGVQTCEASDVDQECCAGRGDQGVAVRSRGQVVGRDSVFTHEVPLRVVAIYLHKQHDHLQNRHSATSTTRVSIPSQALRERTRLNSVLDLGLCLASVGPECDVEACARRDQCRQVCVQHFLLHLRSGERGQV